MFPEISGNIVVCAAVVCAAVGCGAVVCAGVDCEALVRAAVVVCGSEIKETVV
jgi:hypothetical protein